MNLNNIYVSKDNISGNIIQVYIFANDQAAMRNFRVSILDLIDKGNKSMLELMKDTIVMKYDGKTFVEVFNVGDMIPKTSRTTFNVGELEKISPKVEKVESVEKVGVANEQENKN